MLFSFNQATVIWRTSQIFEQRKRIKKFQVSDKLTNYPIPPKVDARRPQKLSDSHDQRKLKCQVCAILLVPINVRVQRSSNHR